MLLPPVFSPHLTPCHPLRPSWNIPSLVTMSLMAPILVPLLRNLTLLLSHLIITTTLGSGFILDMGKSVLRKLHISPKVTQSSKDQSQDLIIKPELRYTNRTARTGCRNSLSGDCESHSPLTLPGFYLGRSDQPLIRQTFSPLASPSGLGSGFRPSQLPMILSHVKEPLFLPVKSKFFCKMDRLLCFSSFIYR